MKRIAFLLAITLIVPFRITLACEPCTKTLNLLETIRNADLIIEGQKIVSGPSWEDVAPDKSKPEWIEIGILKVLKGDPGGTSVKVNSWDELCPYGIVVDEKTYVFFLQKRKVNDEEYEYDAVASGCGLKTLVVEEESVNFGGKAMPLEEFQKFIAIQSNDEDR